jgi:hypothetical protein
MLGIGIWIGQNVAAQSGAPVGTTWATNADWTLSNGSLTALRSGTSTFQGEIQSSAAKSSGTVIFTVNAIGAATNSTLGFDTGANGGTAQLGDDGGAHSIGYRDDGVLFHATSVISTTLAHWTTGDKIKIVKSGAVFNFYKFNTSTLVYDLQISYDTTPGGGTAMLGAAFFAACSLTATGLQLTVDTSGF